MAKMLNGLKGGGKSKEAMRRVLEYWIKEKGESPWGFCGNLPVRLGPWRAGLYGRVGLEAVAASENRVEELPWLAARFKLLESSSYEEMAIPFMWRLDGKTLEWVRMLDGEKDEKGRVITFAEPAGFTPCPMLFVTDEAWKFYSSRDWKVTPKLVEFYYRQERKYSGDLWLICTQHHKDLDVLFNRLCDEYLVCTNYAKRRTGPFRGFPVMTVEHYYSAPGPKDKPKHISHYRLPKLIGETYDTSAGVGMKGGRIADVGQKEEGWHWSGPLIILVLVCLGILGYIFFGGRIFVHMIGGGPGKDLIKASMNRTNTNDRVIVSRSSLSSSNSNSVSGVSRQQPRYGPLGELVGICGLGPDRFILIFSGGENVSSESGRVRLAVGDYYVVDGYAYQLTQRVPRVAPDLRQQYAPSALRITSSSPQTISPRASDSSIQDIKSSGPVRYDRDPRLLGGESSLMVIGGGAGR